MSTFHNAKDLWAFITETTTEEGDIESIYSQSSFLNDLKRSYEELYTNGILIDPILDQAKNQIHAVQLVEKTIHHAIETFNENPDNIEDVYKIFASIPELATDSFETALLHAGELLGPASDPLAKAFRSFCSIRSHILPLERRLHSKEQREEIYTQIKNELDIAAKLNIEESDIEKRFLDKAADKIFNQLFENQEKTELESDFEQHRSERESNQKKCLKQFLRLFLHQNFIFPNINLLNKLGEGKYLFTSPSKRKIEIDYTDSGLLFQVSFLIQKVFDCNAKEALETQDEDFFVRGVAKYKINIHSYNKTGWVAKFEIIDSSLECEEEFIAILDTRNMLEKFQEFLTACLEKIMAYMTLNQSESTHKSKFKSIFFVSDTGSSVSKIISNDKKPCGNILDLTIDNMHLKS